MASSRSVCSLCRREGEKLYLKGARCDSAKCAIQRRNYQPGVHPWSRGRPSEYGIQLREKQKTKRYYGVRERQFARYFHKAERMPGNTGENLLSLLERRLDNVVFLLGFTTSRQAARQAVAHGHIRVNGRRCHAASTLVRVGDLIEPLGRERVLKRVKADLEARRGRPAPSWLSLDDAQLQGRVADLPKREHVEFPIEEQLIVELMSR
ncbi:MAG: 30S ribosomal protein S4 [Planctomycetota bacterium]